MFGVPVRIMFGAMMLLTFPLAFLFPFLASRARRLLYGATIGAAMLILIFEWDSLHFFISATLTYLLCRILPGKVLPYVVLPLAFGHVFFCHLSIQFTNYLDTSTNITGTQMILSLKLMSFAYNCRDGALISKLNAEEYPAEARQKKRAFTKIPSFFEFFAYCFLFATVLAGPYFEYYDFDEWVSMRSHQAMKSQLGKAFRLISFALPCMILAALAPSFPMSFVVDDSSPDLPWDQMIASVFASEALFRTKYYFAWMTAEGSSAAAGFGYRTPDEIPGADKDQKEGDWELLCNVHPLKVEFPSSLATLGTTDWNMSVAKFMRRYIFDRLAGRKSSGRSMSRLVTFLVSAMWHGFYMGYYLFFVTYFAFETVEIYLGRAFKHYFAGPFLSRVWNVLAVCFATIALNYNGVAFVLLDHWLTLKLWQRLHFSVHLAALGLFVLTMFFPKRNPSSRRRPVSTPESKKEK